MSRSEIFDSFVKIAQEKGMISNDSSEAKKKLEQTGRADSLDASAIEALYGVKPDAPKSMEYKKNIMEVAHPNSVVVSPSYDKLNGLVESEIERQNINLHIVHKTPDGLSTHRKYAEKELVLSLVRIGNDLDNKNQDELRVLADTCLEQVNQGQLKKEAIGPLAIVAIVAVALGAIYAHQHLPNLDKGLQQNAERLKGELDDFLASSVSWGVGHEYDQELKQDVQGLKARLNAFMTAYDASQGAIRELEKPRDASELMQISQQPKTQTVLAAYKNLQSLIYNMSSFMDQVEANFSSTAYKTRHTKDKGFLTSLVEDTHLVGGKTSLLADDFEDVVRAISPFKSSVAEILKMLKDAKSIEEKASSDLIAAQSKANKDFGSEYQNVPYQVPPGSKTPGSVMVSNKPDDDLDNALKEYGIPT